MSTTTHFSVNRSPFSKPATKLPYLAIAACMLLTGCGNFWIPGGIENRAVGQRLPDLLVQPLTFEGEPLDLEKLAGRVTLIHFWGTWCPPCVEEIPNIAAIEKAFRERPDFAMLAISSQAAIEPDLEVLRSETAAFLERSKLDLPTFADVEDRTRLAFQRMAGWRGFPATMLIDKKGVIRGVWYGYEHAADMNLEQIIAELLAE